MAEAAAAKLDQLEARLTAELGNAEQAQALALRQTLEAEQASRMGDIRGLRQMVDALVAEQGVISKGLRDELEAMRLDLALAKKQQTEAESEKSVAEPESSKGLKELRVEANHLTEQLAVERAERSQDVEEIRGHFAQTLDDVREHVAKEFAYLQEVIQALQGRVAEAQAAAVPEASNGDAQSSFNVFTEALQLEREARIAEAAELRSLLQQVQVCAPTALELGAGSTAGELKEALGSMRQELAEDIGAQVASATSALRGHVAVGCAELRGELTARLDVYEADLHQKGGKGGQGEQEHLQQRVEAVEVELREVLRLTQMLVASSQQLSSESLAQRRDEANLVTRVTGLERQLAGADEQDSCAKAPGSTLPEEPMALPALICGELKESLEKLVEKVNAQRPDADEELRSPSAPSAVSAPLLSNTCDPLNQLTAAQRNYSAATPPPCAYGLAPVRLVSGSAGNSAFVLPPGNPLVGRMVSQSSQLQRNSSHRLQPDGFGEDTNSQEDATMQALREKVREALSQQHGPQAPSQQQGPQEPNPRQALGSGSVSQGYAPAVWAESPRRGSGPSWHAQVTAVLQGGQQQVPPRAGAPPPDAKYVQARAMDVYMAAAGKSSSGQPGSYVSPAGGVSAATQSQTVARTHSPVAMHRGVSPVVIRQHPVQRAVSPVRR